MLNMSDCKTKSSKMTLSNKIFRIICKKQRSSFFSQIENGQVRSWSYLCRPRSKGQFPDFVTAQSLTTLNFPFGFSFEVRV